MTYGRSLAHYSQYKALVYFLRDVTAWQIHSSLPERCRGCFLLISLPRLVNSVTSVVYKLLVFINAFMFG
jgi:hypothetical protein